MVPMPRWAESVMQDAFGIYRVTRHQAAPMLELPVVDARACLTLSRQTARLLGHAGMPVQELVVRRPLLERAGEQLTWLMDSLRRRGCVLWVDNYSRPRYVYHPAIMGHAQLNCTVTSMLHLQGMRPFIGLVAFSGWERVRGWVVNQLASQWTRMTGVIQQLNAARLRGMVQKDVRVPLTP